jgi:peptidoglycan/xylan/chitin deacetylase (PgdA/CDA1 family)
VNPWAIGLPAAAAAGVGVGLWAAVSPSSQLFGPTLRRLPADVPGRRLALTFDDGPNPAITPRLLDLLERFEARATFFVVGRFARACPELIREINARGHLLANHTDTHPHLAWHSGARNATELRRCEGSVGEALAAGASTNARAEIGAVKMRWMRPPFGFRGPQLWGAMRETGVERVAMWSKLCFDWKPQPAERMIRRLARVGAGDIVLMHDGDYRALGGDRGHNLIALEHWLPRWRDTGLEFVTIQAAEAARGAQDAPRGK